MAVKQKRHTAAPKAGFGAAGFSRLLRLCSAGPIARLPLRPKGFRGIVF